jgi:hypothetical protein
LDTTPPKQMAEYLGYVRNTAQRCWLLDLEITTQLLGQQRIVQNGMHDERKENSKEPKVDSLAGKRKPLHVSRLQTWTGGAAALLKRAGLLVGHFGATSFWPSHGKDRKHSCCCGVEPDCRCWRHAETSTGTGAVPQTSLPHMRTHPFRGSSTRDQSISRGF